MMVKDGGRRIAAPLAPAMVVAAFVFGSWLCQVPAALAQLVPNAPAPSPTLVVPNLPETDPKATATGAPQAKRVRAPEASPPQNGVERLGKEGLDLARRLGKELSEVSPALLPPVRAAAMLLCLIGYVTFYFQRQRRTQAEAEEDGVLTPEEVAFGVDHEWRRLKGKEARP
jgi:hypothetical protein